MMKRTLSIVCLIVLMATAVAPLPALANAVYYYVYTSNGKGLNLRSDISKGNNIIGSIPYGASVMVDEFLESDYWARVDYNGQWGFVMTRYLQRDPPPARPKGNSGGKTTPAKSSGTLDFSGFVTTLYNAVIRPSAPGGFVNLRWAPNKSMMIRERMYDGQSLEVIAQDNTWAQVRIAETGVVGFVMRSFLTQTAAGSGADS